MVTVLSEMAKIFLSYSSLNKDFAEKLASDLSELSHKVWLDEWEIKVGDSIPKKISDGLENSDYVVVILSTSSTVSKWVENEWHAKYWEEIEQEQVKVLPVLLEKCNIPVLLAPKKFADFTKNYTVGFVKLVASIDPVIANDIKKDPAFASNDLTNRISSLVEKAHSRSDSLSQVIAEALRISIDGKYHDLETFCRMELKGWHEIPNEKIPDHRLKEVFLSPYGDLNLSYFGWSGSPSAMFEYMRQNKKEFLPRKMGFPDSVAEIEKKASSYSSTGLYTFTMPLKHFVKDTKDPESPLRIYIPGDSYVNLLESIRREFVQLLLDQLPSVEG